MYNTRQYVAIPAQITRTITITPLGNEDIKNKCLSGVISGILMFGFLIMFFVNVKYISNYHPDTVSSLCRVNSTDTGKVRIKTLDMIFPVWNVDIMQQSTRNNKSKGLIILRSGLQIIGTTGAQNRRDALKDAQRLYSVNNCFLQINK